MSKLKALTAAAALAAMVITPAMANGRHYRHHRHHYWPLPYSISYLHNYGPGAVPGTFAYYDGPSTIECYHSSATYIGQDRRRHPCY
jgi:hypothetical protein